MTGVFDPTRRRQLAPSHVKLDSAAVAAFAINEQFKADAEARADEFSGRVVATVAGHKIIEGAGKNGGEWATQSPNGKWERHKSREEAEQVARAKGDDCDDPMDAGPKMDAEPQVRKLPSGMWEVSIGGRIFNVMSSVKTEAEAVANAKEYLRHIEAGERRGSRKSDAEFTEKETREAEKTPKERREDVPEKAFLDPPDKYPVMTKQGGDWKYSKDMLEAAESRAAQQGRRDLANRAKEILVREFGVDKPEGKADASIVKTEDVPNRHGKSYTIEVHDWGEQKNANSHRYHAYWKQTNPSARVGGGKTVEQAIASLKSQSTGYI